MTLIYYDCVVVVVTIGTWNRQDYYENRYGYYYNVDHFLLPLLLLLLSILRIAVGTVPCKSKSLVMMNMTLMIVSHSWQRAAQVLAVWSHYRQSHMLRASAQVLLALLVVAEVRMPQSRTTAGV